METLPEKIQIGQTCDEVLSRFIKYYHSRICRMDLFGPCGTALRPEEKNRREDDSSSLRSRLLEQPLNAGELG